MKKLASLLGIMVAVVALSRTSIAAEPVHITYGYHPYWVGGWNGVIIKAKALWKRYLPPGSTVKFEPYLTGPPMVNALLADKMQIGTMGDTPSLVATTKRTIADLRLVSVPMFSNGQLCDKIVVRKSAPDFKDYREALKWLSGKPFAAHKGTCADMFTQFLVTHGAFKPSQVLSMPIEVITSNFQAGKLDAAAMWEPHAAHVVEQGYAKYVATGAPWKFHDADFTLMRQDFIEKHPEAAVGWLKAEIEAVEFMIKHPRQTVDIIHKELTGYDRKTVWAALYEVHSSSIGGDPVNYVAKMVFDQDVTEHMKKVYEFLSQIKVIQPGAVPQNPVNDAPLKQALREMRITAPVGEIRGQAPSAYATLFQ